MTTLEEKQAILKRLRLKHPDRVPVLVSRKEDSDLPLPNNTK